MDKKFVPIIIFLLATITFFACKKDQPVDEDGLLITTRAECVVTNFELLGTDYVTVRTGTAVIDTIAQTVKVQVKYGTDLKNLYPQFTLSSDAKLDPKVSGRVDFSDLTTPKVYSVVSGNRKIRKPFTVMITVQPR